MGSLISVRITPEVRDTQKLPMTELGTKVGNFCLLCKYTRHNFTAQTEPFKRLVDNSKETSNWARRFVLANLIFIRLRQGDGCGYWN